MANSARGSKDILEKLGNDLEAKIQKNGRLSNKDMTDAWARANEFLGNASESVGALGGVATALSSYVDHPESLLGSDEINLEPSANLAFKSIQGLDRSCRVAQAENDLQSFVLIGQQSLTEARLAAARAGKQERTAAEAIDRNLRKPMNWRDPAQAELNRMLVGPELFDAWARPANLKQDLSRKQESLDRTLRQGGDPCGRLREQIKAVQQRREGYQRTVARAELAVRSCQPDATRLIGEFQGMEDSRCGAFLTMGCSRSRRAIPSRWQCPPPMNFRALPPWGTIAQSARRHRNS